jgi:hypothetical protein
MPRRRDYRDSPQYQRLLDQYEQMKRETRSYELQPSPSATDAAGVTVYDISTLPGGLKS